ncbi:MAG: hypothetical protein ACYTBZ_23435 [Planctomycetota bacterium]|jgi:hypothetical protein
MKIATSLIVAFLALLISESTSYIEAQTASGQSSTSLPGSHELIISQISTTQDSFNPSAGEGLEIRYTISRPGQLSFQIYDSEWMLIREVISESPDGGPGAVYWDGKDFAGNIVPDESIWYCSFVSQFSAQLEIKMLRLTHKL